jgi:hypothetical protein
VRVKTVFVVMGRNRQVFAVRDSLAAANEAIVEAELYLDGALSCGHPSAPAWVGERKPFGVECVGLQSRLDELLAGNVPVLDREGGL